MTNMLVTNAEMRRANPDIAADLGRDYKASVADCVFYGYSEFIKRFISVPGGRN